MTRRTAVCLITLLLTVSLAAQAPVEPRARRVERRSTPRVDVRLVTAPSSCAGPGVRHRSAAGEIQIVDETDVSAAFASPFYEVRKYKRPSQA
jgi:hypothetical protein